MKRLFKPLAMFAVAAMTAMPGLAQVSEGDTPELDLVSIEGVELTNETLAGKVVVIDFWATWCGPCVASMPHMEELYEQFHESGVEVIGISLDGDRNALDRFVEQRELPWHITYSGDAWDDATANKFGVRGIPALFILSPESEVIWTGHPANLTELTMQQIVDEYLGDTAMSASERAMARLQEAQNCLEIANYHEMVQCLSRISLVGAEDEEVKEALQAFFNDLETNIEEPEAFMAAVENAPQAMERLTDLYYIAFDISDEPIKVGAVPTIDWQDINGQAITNETLAGDIVIVDFWATWCGPCVAALPHMKDIHEEYGDQGVTIIGVSLDQDVDSLKYGIEEHGLEYTMVFDENQAIAGPWGITGIPHIYILNGSGEILWHGHPSMMDEPLEQALAARESE